MRIIALLVLFLEFVTLAITLKTECRKNNITFSNAKTKWKDYKYKRIQNKYKRTINKGGV